MNELEQRIAIAKACGWTFKNVEDGSGECWHSPTGLPMFRGTIPDYLYDLNAMHEAEKCIPDAERYKYIEMLATVCGEEEDWYDGWGLSAMESVARATAKQRAEAFLRVVGKWVES